MSNANNLPETANKNVEINLRSDGSSIFDTTAQFEGALRVATMLSKATGMVPQVFQNNIPNCMVALNYAKRTGADVLMIMQEMYIVYGKPSFSSKFLIGLINNSKKYKGGLKFDFFDEGKGDNFGCRAYGICAATGEKSVGPDVTIAIAKADGWYDKKGSKWQTIPKLMLMYRAASFFANMYVPELRMGMKTTDEIQDVEYEEIPNSQLTEESIEKEIKTEANTEIIDVSTQNPNQPVSEPDEKNTPSNENPNATPEAKQPPTQNNENSDSNNNTLFGNNSQATEKTNARKRN